jgi:hypothetical protein
MPNPTDSRTTAPTHPPMRDLLIVARDRVHLYEFLQHAYGGSEEITILLDRRNGDRRQAAQPVLEERRGRERRRPPTVADDVRFQPYVLVSPHSRRPHD